MRWLVGACMIVSTLLLGACASPETAAPTSPATSASAATQSVTTSAQPTTVAPETASVFAGTVDVVDKDGYTYRLSYRYSGLSEPTTSIANDRPGHASAHLTANSGMDIKNTTPGRSAPQRGSIYIYAFYQIDRPICQLTFSKVADKSYCSIIVGSLGNGVFKLDFDGVKEADLSAALDDIRTPAEGYAVVGSLQPTNSLSGPNDCVFSLDGDMVENTPDYAAYAVSVTLPFCKAL